MNKKVIIASALVLVATIAIPVFAQTTNTTPTTTTASEPQVLDVGQAGNVLLRGTIASISNGIMTVNGWGGVWTVNIPSSASIYPAATTNYATQFQVGDFVGVQGSISTSANWTVNATLVRDWTYRAAVTAQVKANVQSAQGIRAAGPKDYVGTASAVSASSFTLAANNGTSYTVTVPSGAEIVNVKWLTIPLTNINSGDNVRVYGVNASGTITAQIVRDVTIAATTTAQ